MSWEDCGHVRGDCGFELSQGDVFDLGQICMMERPAGSDVAVRQVECPEGVVVISQTCDALLSPTVQVAQLVSLDERAAKEASTGKRPRYLPVRVGEEGKFADLSCVATVGCECLCSSRLIAHGAETLDSQRLFRDLASRRFGRFPFPDDVVAWCRPLREKIAPKAKRNGSQGELLKRVRCIRIEDGNNWENPLSYQLTLTFLTESGTMPVVDDDDDFTVPDAIEQALKLLDYGKRAERLSDYICSRTKYGLSDGAICTLWGMLANAWVAQCNEKYGADGHIARVSGTAIVVPEDEYTFDQMRYSEQLDLDYLSRG